MRAFASVLVWFAMVAAVVAETRVVIAGAQRSTLEINSLLGDRLAHVRASPPSPPLADDAAFMLRQLLVKDGHSGAAVTWKITGPDEITLIVNEGARSHIGAVTIDGVPAEDVKKLAAIYVKPATAGGRGLGFEKPPYRQADVDTGLSYVRQELFANGYWSAQVALASGKPDAASGAVDLHLKVARGPLYQIASPRTDCVNPKAAVLVAKISAPFVGRSAKTSQLNSMRRAVETAVKASGYPNAEIRMEQTLEGSRFIPKFVIIPGKRVKLHEVIISGLKKTQPHRVARRLKPLEGDWYDEVALQKQVGKLLATGAFSSVRIETRDSGPDCLDALVTFEEGKAREFTAGVGFGSYEGALLRAGYSDRNLFGDLLGFTAGIEAGSRGLLGEARLTDPWLFGTDISSTLRFYALNYGREGYDTFETGIEDRFRWKYADHFSLEFLAGYSVVSASADGLPDFALGLLDYQHTRFRISHTIDYRDNPVLPKNGWHLENHLQIGSAVGDESFGYFMAGLAGGWVRPIGRKYELGIGGEVSVIMPSCDLFELPIDLRLFNGGARTVRSFPERELGPVFEGYAFGGESAWSANIEFSRRIGDSLKLVSFIDAGSIAGLDLSLLEADIELAIGLGVRLDLPIGPVRFEYGYNLTRDPWEPTGAFHFAIGAAF